jgi:hypothetical protein
LFEPTTNTGPIITPNNVTIGGTCLGDDFVPPGTVGALFRVEFVVVGSPPKGGALDTYVEIIPSDEWTFILNNDLAIVPTDKINAHYHYDWVAPPPPHLAVVGGVSGYYEFGPYPPSVINQTFNVDIYVEDLNPDWWLHSIDLCLCYNTTLINVTTVDINTLFATREWTYVEGAPGELDEVHIHVDTPSPNPSGNVRIATLTFIILYQGESPPRPPFAYDESPLDICDYELWDTTIQIPTTEAHDGRVRIYCLLALPLPYLEVSSVTMGPEPCRGKEFNVTVSIKRLDSHWYFIGLQFRLRYDPSLIEPVAAYEGPFLPYWASQHPGPIGNTTFFVSYFEPDTVYEPHVLIGNMIFPNETGMWNLPFPEGEGVVAIITFKVVYQSFGEPDRTGPLNIIEQMGLGLDNLEDQNIVDVTFDYPRNGVYTITTNWPGRVIDLYGGALNKGYGSIPFPEPYGGQGPNNPMDKVFDQAEVGFFASVTYNYWPVQHKMVAFEVQDPKGNVWLKATAVTNEDGLAYISFQMPWPCEGAEDLFGVWTVTATVSISDIRVIDTLQFHYDYLVTIFKVTTDKFEYNHCEYVEITIKYGTHAQQWYPLLLTVVIFDELQVPIGMATVETEVGGAVFCSYKNFTVTLRIHILKFAFAGIATIHVNAFDFDPTEGGTSWCPEYTPAPEIAIQPY